MSLGSSCDLCSDTNTLIYFFKGVGRVGDRILSTPPSDIAIPAVVFYELEVVDWY
jgi:tRNA(fMet)-specific endonuclease VapC